MEPRIVTLPRSVSYGARRGLLRRVGYSEVRYRGRLALFETDRGAVLIERDTGTAREFAPAVERCPYQEVLQARRCALAEFERDSAGGAA